MTSITKRTAAIAAALLMAASCALPAVQSGIAPAFDSSLVASAAVSVPNPIVFAVKGDQDIEIPDSPNYYTDSYTFPPGIEIRVDSNLQKYFTAVRTNAGSQYKITLLDSAKTITEPVEIKFYNKGSNSYLTTVKIAVYNESMSSGSGTTTPSTAEDDILSWLPMSRPTQLAIVDIANKVGGYTTDNSITDIEECIIKGAGSQETKNKAFQYILQYYIDHNTLGVDYIEYRDRGNLSAYNDGYTAYASVVNVYSGTNPNVSLDYIVDVNNPDSGKRYKEYGTNESRFDYQTVSGGRNLYNCNYGPRHKTISLSAANLTEITAKFGALEALEVFNLTNSVSVSIGESCFAGCANLKQVELQAVKGIGAYAFRGCTNLTSISLRNSTAYKVDNGAILTADGKTLVAAPAVENYTVPEGVETIMEGAFADNTNLTSVVIPKSVKTIGISAFEGCSNLNSVDIQGAVKIESNAFKGTTSLGSIDIPAGSTYKTSDFESTTKINDSSKTGDEIIDVTEIEHGVTLGSDIYLVPVVPVNSDKELKITATIGGEAVNANDIKIESQKPLGDGTTEYKVRIPVNAPDMGKTINVTYTCEDCTVEENYSIPEYAEEYASTQKGTDGYDSNMRVLSAMLMYGETAAKHFGESTANFGTAFGEENVTYKTTVNVDDLKTVDDAVVKATTSEKYEAKNYASLVLNENIDLNCYTDSTESTVYFNYKRDNDYVRVPATKSGTFWKGTITDFSIVSLDKTCDFYFSTDAAGSNHITNTMTYNPLGWVSGSWRGNYVGADKTVKESNQKLAASLYSYYKAVKAAK